MKTLEKGDKFIYLDDENPNDPIHLHVIFKHKYIHKEGEDTSSNLYLEFEMCEFEINMEKEDDGEGLDLNYMKGETIKIPEMYLDRYIKEENEELLRMISENNQGSVLYG